MQPTIRLYPHVKFDKDGPVTCFAAFTAPDPFTKGVGSVNREIVLDQPATWHTDDDLLKHIQARYPDCDVAWMPVPKPATEDV